MRKQYYKLVRDRIPEIITATGQQCSTRVLDPETYLQMLDKKLTEELAEYQAEGNVEELADLLEVIYAVAQARGCSAEALEDLRRQKAEKRGGFAERILLEEVWE